MAKMLSCSFFFFFFSYFFVVMLIRWATWNVVKMSKWQMIVHAAYSNCFSSVVLVSSM